MTGQLGQDCFLLSLRMAFLRLGLLRLLRQIRGHKPDERRDTVADPAASKSHFAGRMSSVYYICTSPVMTRHAAAFTFIVWPPLRFRIPLGHAVAMSSGHTSSCGVVFRLRLDDQFARHTEKMTTIAHANRNPKRTRENTRTQKNARDAAST